MTGGGGGTTAALVVGPDGGVTKAGGLEQPQPQQPGWPGWNKQPPVSGMMNGFMPPGAVQWQQVRWCKYSEVHVALSEVALNGSEFTQPVINNFEHQSSVLNILGDWVRERSWPPNLSGKTMLARQMPD